MAAVWSGAMMLEHLGERQAANAIMTALNDVLSNKDYCTPDMGGAATTAELADAMVKSL